ncbi:hypothetical protein B0H14DRAFT_2344442 [Mycena olivaceomarginata]|nr:hypothetical protein B0H14DRAFT_2373933 [Mycena olivaceomarginata]KAJ7873150.1 hypothetical protein B0H14DRAFT_2344442 [Mycena olivaceomarginata]
MSVNIVLPPLKAWAEQHLSSIIQATTKTAFDSAFDAFLSKNATITLNGKDISRDEYQKQLQGEGFDEAGATVQFSGAVEVPSEINSIQVGGGSVGLFYTALIAENIVVQDASVQRQITSSLNLVIEEDKSLTPPNLPHGIHGFFDGRRVSVLNQIILDVPVQ